MYNLVFFVGMVLVFGSSLFIQGHTHTNTTKTDILLAHLSVCLLLLSLPLIVLPSKNRISYRIHVSTMQIQIILLKILLHYIQADDHMGYVIACHTSQYILIELNHVYQSEVLDIFVILVTPFYMLYHYNINSIPHHKEHLYLSHLIGILVTHVYTYSSSIKHAMIEFFY
jgi:hypothetical protein